MSELRLMLTACVVKWRLLRKVFAEDADNYECFQSFISDQIFKKRGYQTFFREFLDVWVALDVACVAKWRSLRKVFAEDADKFECFQSFALRQ